MTTLAPGDGIVQRRTGAARIISHRKATDDGWWLLDGSGIADRVLRDDWVPASAMAAVLREIEWEVDSAGRMPINPGVLRAVLSPLTPGTPAAGGERA